MSENHVCPTCGQSLLRHRWWGRWECTNPECPIIYVTYHRGFGCRRVRRTWRRAEARAAPLL